MAQLTANFWKWLVRRLVTGVVVIVITITPVIPTPAIRLLNGAPIKWRLIQEPYLPVFTVFGSSDLYPESEIVTTALVPRPDSRIALYEGAALVDLWNQELFYQIRKYKINPIIAARIISLVNVSVYDAILLSERMHLSHRLLDTHRNSDVYIMPNGEICNASMALVGSAAAESVLEKSFPLELLRFSARFKDVSDAYLITKCVTQKELREFRKVGRAVSDALVELMTGNESQIVWNGTVPISEDGWKPLRKLSRPLLPAAGRWRPWLLSDGAEFRPSSPPIVGSLAWRADADEVVMLSENLSPSQLITARFWNDGMGTLTPGGHWLQYGIELAKKYRTSLPQTARMTAYLSMAIYDSFIACWDAKYTYWTARPEQLLPDFFPAIPTPPFPAFPSGHATVSAAAAEVLGSIFPLEYQVVLDMAHEAAESRISGGIHWRIDSTTGLNLGASVGRRAVTMLASD